MRPLLIAVLACLLVPRAWGAACDTRAQHPSATSELEAAAMGLGAHEWCEMSPTIENGATMYDLLHTCVVGQTETIQDYANAMAYNQPAQEIFFFGTPHGGGHRSIRYSIANNTWTVGPQPSSGWCGATCNPGLPENRPINACASCNAGHTYDSNTVDSQGNYYFMPIGGGNIARLPAGGSTWSTSWKTCPGAAASSAMVYWPTINSLIAICGTNMDGLYRYDLSTGSWSTIASGLWSPTYHNQMTYHPVADQIWITQGNGQTGHKRVYLEGGTPKVATLGNAPSGRLGVTDEKCVADPASASKFVCWSISGDASGSTSAGWYEFDLATNQWTSFSSLGISSMPPVAPKPGDSGFASMTTASITDHGVMVFVVAETEWGNDTGGMFVYKHTSGTQSQNPPPDPGNLRAVPGDN